MRLTILALLAAAFAFAQSPKPDWNKWWPEFQAAVAKHDAKAIADVTYFPTQWEMGKIRRVENKAVFMQKFDAYFPDHMRQAIATQKPEAFPDGSYLISWSRGQLDYSLEFRPDGKGGYRLENLSENSPH